MCGITNQDLAPSSTAMDSPNSKRLYQVWKGRNRFYWGGRLIFGPDASSLLLSTILIGAPAITFCVRMFLRISEADPFYGHAVLMVGIVLTILDLSFLFMTSVRDPGIVPRNSRPPESDESLNVSTASMEWLNSTTHDLKLPKMKDVIVNGHTVKVKYCDTCFLYRPVRASHCSICNNCVQRFDHHCPWVGQCIGIRNYRSFILFISSSTILCLYVFTFSLLNILQEQGSLWKIMARDIISVALVVYCFVAVWFVGGLSVLHSYLICTNKTTYENFRYRYDKKQNPYNRGIIKNVKEIVFSKSPPSLLNFREWVTGEDASIVESITHRFAGETFSSKEKFNIEMGGMLSKDKPIPYILQNLDCGGIEDNLKKKDGDRNTAFDPFLFPYAQELNDVQWSSIHGDGSIEDDRTEDATSQRISSTIRQG